MTERILHELIDAFPKLLIPAVKVTIPLTLLSFSFGLLIALVNKFGKHKPKKKEFGCAGCPQAAACGRADCGGCAGQTEAEVSAQ